MTFLYLAICSIPALFQGPTLPPPSTSDQFECGVLSTYNLLKLCGKDVDLISIDALFPRDEPTGSSFADIVRACKKHGLNVLVTRLARQDRIDSPAIAFLRTPQDGHFVVVRPVGHSGRLLQLLDPNREPSVVEASELFASPQWTGLILTPSRPNRLGQIAVLLGIMAGVLWTTALIRKKVRNPGK